MMYADIKNLNEEDISYNINKDNAISILKEFKLQAVFDKEKRL